MRRAPFHSVTATGNRNKLRQYASEDCALIASWGQASSRPTRIGFWTFRVGRHLYINFVPCRYLPLILETRCAISWLRGLRSQNRAFVSLVWPAPVLTRH